MTPLELTRVVQHATCTRLYSFHLTVYVWDTSLLRYLKRMLEDLDCITDEQAYNAITIPGFVGFRQPLSIFPIGGY